METLTIIRLVGYVLLGIGGGYLGSLLLGRCAASRFLTSRRRMAIAGGLVGICVTVATGSAYMAAGPPLEPLATINQLDNALAAAVDQPVAVVFYAEWCPPSRKMLRVTQPLARDLADQTHVYRVNVDEAMSLRKRFGIRSVPTVVYFQSGSEVDRTIGLVGRPHLQERLVKMIAIAATLSPKPDVTKQ